MAHDFQSDLDTVALIESVPAILEVVCRTTGMGFAAIARVTEDRWVACAVRDEIAFGLQAGGELQVETTICNEIRASGRPVFIDHVAEDEAFCGHPTPALHGFQSYISVPIQRPGGAFFGTLCAIDPRPAKVSRTEVVQMFRLFADLIAFQLEAHERVAATFMPRSAAAASTSRLLTRGTPSELTPERSWSHGCGGSSASCVLLVADVFGGDPRRSCCLGVVAGST